MACITVCGSTLYFYPFDATAATASISNSSCYIHATCPPTHPSSPAASCGTCLPCCHQVKELNKGIAEFYNESSSLWEKVWGEHMHHGECVTAVMLAPSHPAKRISSCSSTCLHCSLLCAGKLAAMEDAKALKTHLCGSPAMTVVVKMFMTVVGQCNTWRWCNPCTLRLCRRPVVWAVFDSMSVQ